MFGPVIAGTHLKLAPPLPQYIDNYLRWFSDPVVTRFLELRNPPTREQEEEWLRQRAANTSDVVWAVMHGDNHIGAVGIHNIDWRNRTATTGTVIGETAFWGQGLGTEAIRLRTAYAFNELGLESVNTRVYAPNEPSRRALVKAGYREVGWLRHNVYFEGVFHDVWLGEALRGEWPAPSA